MDTHKLNVYGHGGCAPVRAPAIYPPAGASSAALYATIAVGDIVCSWALDARVAAVTVTSRCTGSSMSVPIGARMAPHRVAAAFVALGPDVDRKERDQRTLRKLVEVGEELAQAAADDRQRHVVDRRAMLAAHDKGFEATSVAQIELPPDWPPDRGRCIGTSSPRTHY